ncbi:hypothetical protein NM208_g15102 [Fusarium decemcellulare]|uniref:Uncharacterized protein n=1 Tax=Fusarium decemcellulare TaxID=57161 RepID=A0ACC1RE41_9HYPO|nr:hypothetical protein NM208_g15102 [Fusarium decemcellulare]
MCTSSSSATELAGAPVKSAREGFNLSTGALFLMGGIYPRTNAILKELGHDKDLVPWKATTHVVDWDRHRYTARFDSVVSFIGMPVFNLLDRLKMAIGVIKVWLSPGPRSLFDGAELALYDHGETLDTWSDRVLGKKGTNYLTLPYMGFLYAVPCERMINDPQRTMAYLYWVPAGVDATFGSRRATPGHDDVSLIHPYGYYDSFYLPSPGPSTKQHVGSKSETHLIPSKPSA